MTQVFEGTIAGQKFLFLAQQEALEKVAEIPAGKSAEQIALENSVELIARAKANHVALKALFKAWAQFKRAQRASSPETQAELALKLEMKEHKAKLKAEAKIEKAKLALAEKIAKLEQKAAA